MLKKVSYSVLTRFFGMAVTLLTFMLTARYFGPDGRGHIATITSFANMLAVLGGLSIGRVLVYEIARSGKSVSEFYAQNLFSVVVLFCVLSVVAVLLTLGLYFIKPNLFGETPLFYYLIFFIAVPSFIWQSASSFIFSSLDSMEKQNHFSLIVLLLNILLSYLFILVFHATVLEYLILIVVMHFFTTFLELRYLVKKVQAVFIIHYSLWKTLLWNGAKIHLDALGGVLTSYSSIIIINAHMTSRDVGIYQFALQLVGMISVLPSMVSFQFNADIAALGSNHALLKHVKYMGSVLILIIGVIFAGYFVAPLLMPLIASKSFNDSIPVFQLLLLSTPGQAFALMMSTQWSSRGYFIYISVLNITLGIIGLLSSYLWIQGYGIDGAAYSAILVNTIAFIVNIVFFGLMYQKSKKSMQLS